MWAILFFVRNRNSTEWCQPCLRKSPYFICSGHISLFINHNVWQAILNGKAFNTLNKSSLFFHVSIISISLSLSHPFGSLTVSFLCPPSLSLYFNLFLSMRLLYRFFYRFFFFDAVQKQQNFSFELIIYGVSFLIHITFIRAPFKQSHTSICTRTHTFEWKLWSLPIRFIYTTRIQYIRTHLLSYLFG